MSEVFVQAQFSKVCMEWKFSDSLELEVYRKTYKTPTKESRHFQLLVHQDSPHRLGRKVGHGREFSLL